jgi:hypothetical protein
MPPPINDLSRLKGRSNARTVKMIHNQDELTFDFRRLGRGEAKGRYAITALVVAVTIRLAAFAFVAAEVVSFTIKAFLS